MFKGYKNRLLEKNKRIHDLGYVTKCSRCLKLNPTLYSPASNNIQNCLFCGNPFYIIKSS
jgi:hypothetical protein